MKKLAFLLLILCMLLGDGLLLKAQSLSNSLPTSKGEAWALNAGSKKKKKTTEKPKQKKIEVLTDLNFYGGLDASFGFPVGKIRDTVANGMGFLLRAEYFFLPELNLGITTGYKSYKYDEVMVGEGHYSYIPVKLTGTYYFNDEKIRPYANLGLGMYRVRQKYDSKNWILVQNMTTQKIDTIFEIKGMDSKGWDFGFSPNVGVLYNFLDEYYAHLNLGYEMIFTEPKSSGFFNLSIGVVYKFGF